MRQSRKPAYIYDGYGLIENFVVQLQNFHFTHLPKNLQKNLSAPVVSKTIPRIKHFVWIANKLISTTDWNCVKEFVLLNKHFTTILWVNMDLDSKDPEARQIIDEAATNAIFIVDFRFAIAHLLEDVNASKIFDLPYVIKNLLTQRKYVQVAAIFRVVVMYLYGGLYSDFDNPVIKPIDADFLRTEYGLKIFKFLSVNPRKKFEFNNNLISGLPKHPDLLAWLRFFVETAETNYGYTFNLANRSNIGCVLIHNYAESYAREHFVYAQQLTSRTGPHLDPLYATMIPNAEAIAEEYFDDAGIHCPTWATPDTYRKVTQEKISVDEALTVIMNELYLEPRILKLSLLFISPAWVNVEKTPVFYREIIRRIVTNEDLRARVSQVEKICYPSLFDFDLILVGQDKLVTDKIRDKAIVLQKISGDKLSACFAQNGEICLKEVTPLGIENDDLTFPNTGADDNIIPLHGNENLVKTVAMLCGCAEQVYFFTPEIVKLIFDQYSPFKNLATTQYFLSPGLFDILSTNELLKFAKFQNEINLSYAEVQNLYRKYGDVIEPNSFATHQKMLNNFLLKNQIVY